MLSNTAILVFSRLPHEEILHKKISLNTEVNLALFQHLYSKTIAAAKKTSLPIIISSENDQQGTNFAEKISNAISGAFNQGFDNLIVVGGDSPDISSNHIITALLQLKQGKEIVAGQDKRGGIYLLGLNKNAFDTKNFLEFRWQTNHLFKDIAAYALNFSFIKIASTLQDINSLKDISTYIYCVAVSQSFKSVLHSLFKTIQNKQQIFSKNILASLFVFHYILRGPPSRS